MRNTLIIGLLLCLPVAVLLASASLAVLADKLRRRSSRSAGPGTVLPDADRVAGRIPGHRHRPILVGQVSAVFAQASAGGQRDELFGLGPVVVDWRHREDEPALAEADRLDQDGTAGPGQDDHITGVDIASKDHIFHR